MFRRDLDPETVAALLASPVWHNLVADRELHPEVRDGHVTVYCYGCGLIRELRLQNGRLVAKIHSKYVPLRLSPSEELGLVAEGGGGFGFAVPPEPLPLGGADPKTLAFYKERLLKDPEARLVQAILADDRNAVLDQEIAFADTRDDQDRIDLCYFDPAQEKLIFVEVKRVDDPRLFAVRGRPEILDQLLAYCSRLSANRADILTAYRRVVVLKRRLGLGGRIASVPADGPADLLEKPLLVIGGCSSAMIPEIKAGSEKWAPLLAELKDVASGLILCGDQGCKLLLANLSHTLSFI